MASIRIILMKIFTVEAIKSRLQYCLHVLPCWACRAMILIVLVSAHVLLLTLNIRKLPWTELEAPQKL